MHATAVGGARKNDVTRVVRVRCHNGKSDRIEAASGSATMVILKSGGATPTERLLAKLCEQTFLGFWSYPNTYRDQGGPKELCDLLVVSGNNIIIFSDKRCAFPDTGDLKLDWSRWYRKAILGSAQQSTSALSGGSKTIPIVCFWTISVRSVSRSPSLTCPTAGSTASSWLSVPSNAVGAILGAAEVSHLRPCFSASLSAPETGGNSWIGPEAVRFSTSKAAVGSSWRTPPGIKKHASSSSTATSGTGSFKSSRPMRLVGH